MFTLCEFENAKREEWVREKSWVVKCTRVKREEKKLLEKEIKVKQNVNAVSHVALLKLKCS